MCPEHFSFLPRQAESSHAESTEYFIVRPCAAVLETCAMCTKRKVFEAFGGFSSDESEGLDFYGACARH